MIHIFPIELRFLTSSSCCLLAGRSDGDIGAYDFVFHTVIDNLAIMSRASQEYIFLTRRDKSAEILEKSIFALWRFNHPTKEKPSLTQIKSIMWRGKAEKANRWAIALQSVEAHEQFEVILPEKGSIMWDISMLEDKFKLEKEARECLADSILQFNSAQIYSGLPSPFVLRL